MYIRTQSEVCIRYITVNCEVGFHLLKPDLPQHLITVLKLQHESFVKFYLKTEINNLTAS